MRYRETKKGKMSKEGLAPEKKIVEKKKKDYKGRYNGLLSSEKEIVETCSPTYPSRYK